MNRLTPEERRRVYQTQQRARENMLGRLSRSTLPSVDRDNEVAPRRVMLAAVIGAMLGASLLLAWQALEFHPPSSVVEALLPRL